MAHNYYVERYRKETLLKTFIVSSCSLFVLPRIGGFRFRHSMESILLNHFTFHQTQPKLHTRFTYALNHATIPHLAFNMTMLWVMGQELVKDRRVNFVDMAGLFALSSFVASFSESISVGRTASRWISASVLSRPMVGASGIAMGLLGASAVLDPNKTWLLIFPIPGVTVSSRQLLQLTFFSHVGVLAWRAFSSSWQMGPAYKIAVKGHLGGLIAGYMLAKLLYPRDNQGDFSSYIEVSRHEWERTLGSAWLVAYWVYLSLKLPFTQDDEYGVFAAKKRFIQRTWREDF